jgi:hypothetical protein
VQASTLSKCEFSFCNREANAVADWLVREMRSLPSVWVDEPPGFIKSLLIDDVTIIWSIKLTTGWSPSCFLQKKHVNASRDKVGDSWSNWYGIRAFPLFAHL